MNTKYKSTILTLLCASALGVSAQDLTAVHGVVNDEIGAIIGASVCEIDGSGRIIESTVTDVNGNFSMKVRNPKNKIRFSYVGYKTISMAINKSEYNIMLTSDTQIEAVTVTA